MSTLLLKYSDDQERDERGVGLQWLALARIRAVQTSTRQARSRFKPAQGRAFSGEPVSTKIKASPTRDGQDHRGGGPAAPTRMGFKDAENATQVGPWRYFRGNHYAMDVYADHQAVELKAGRFRTASPRSSGESSTGRSQHTWPACRTSKRPRLHPAAGEAAEGQRGGSAVLQKERGKKVSPVT